MRKIQVKLLTDEGLLLRGGTILGGFYADENLAFRKGLICAVGVRMGISEFAIKCNVKINERLCKPEEQFLYLKVMCDMYRKTGTCIQVPVLFD